jgi:hypothetical protein
MNSDRVASELVKIARDLVSVTNYLKMLKKKQLGRGRGSYAWSGKIDGVNVYVVRNASDASLKTVAWWDIKVGEEKGIETSSRNETSEKDVNIIIDRLLNYVQHKQKMINSGPLSAGDVKRKLKDMRHDISLGNSELEKISKDVYSKLSKMDEKSLGSMRRKGRVQMVISEDNGDEHGIVEGALFLIYAKILLLKF